MLKIYCNYVYMSIIKNILFFQIDTFIFYVVSFKYVFFQLNLALQHIYRDIHYPYPYGYDKLFSIVSFSC
jgi:hypothetical protein